MKQYKDKLYIKDSLGKIREWYLTYDDTQYIKNYGVLNGETISSVTNVHEGKNIGKSNVTSVSTQVIKECESAYKDQKKRGYKSYLDVIINNKVSDTELNVFDLYDVLDRNLSSSKTDENNYLKPMKAQPKGTVKFPCFIQPKINGVRATISLTTVSDGLFGTRQKAQIKSKEGLVYSIKHLEEQAYNILSLNPSIVLDGEIYIAGEHVTSIGGAARNTNNPLNSKLGFVCFDLSIPVLSQTERIVLKNTLKMLSLNTTSFCNDNLNKSIHSYIFNCPCDMVNTLDEVLVYTERFIEWGFEGSITRDMDAEYKFGGRPNTMIKHKKWYDAEFQILDIYASDKSGQTMFLCKNDLNDLTFSVDGTVEYLDNKFIVNKQLYIGKMATVKFYERTINNLPFQTTLIGIRDYEF